MSVDSLVPVDLAPKVVMGSFSSRDPFEHLGRRFSQIIERKVVCARHCAF